MRIFYCLLLLIIFALPAFSQETFTLTTYYPAPFGVYNELRSKRMAIGDNYFQNSVYPWYPETGPNGKQIGQNTDLVVEGNVGIGTYAPIAPLDVTRAIVVRTQPPPTPPNAIENDMSFIGFRDRKNEQLGFIGDGTQLENNVTVASRNSIDFYTYQNVAPDGGGIPGSDKMTITNAGRVGIGTDDPRGPLDVNSTSGGLVFPRMNANQRNAIANPADGTVIFNTTTGQLELYVNPNWIAVGGKEMNAVAIRQDNGTITPVSGPIGAFVKIDNVKAFPNIGSATLDGLGCDTAGGWHIMGCWSTGSTADLDIVVGEDGNSCVTNDFDQMTARMTVVCEK